MKTHRQCRQTFEGDFGQSRLFISSNDSLLLFHPSVDGYALDWSTKDPGVLALRTVLRSELTEGQLGLTTVLYGHPFQTIEGPGTPKIVQKFFDLTDAFESNPDDPSRQIPFARFDFPTRSITLASLEPDFTISGVGYTISRTNGRSTTADVQALRRAFMDTAEVSIMPEFDWALKALLP